MKRFLLFLIFGISLSSFGQIVPTTARLSLSADSVLIGDTLRLNVDIDKDVATELSVAMFKDNMLTDKIEILGIPSVDTVSRQGRHVKLRLGYTITSFDAGRYKLDSFPVLVGSGVPFDTLYTTGEAGFAVGTFEIDTLKQSPEDIKPMLSAPWQWSELGQWMSDNWWIMATGLLLVAIVVAGIWWWRRRKNAILQAEALLPAHQRALIALEALHSKKLWQSGHAKEYFSALTDILRKYIENRYGIAAMEMTSSEIGRALVDENNEKLLTPIRDLLFSADLVKFAKWIPDAKASETAYFDVYYYVEQTKLEEDDSAENSD